MWIFNKKHKLFFIFFLIGCLFLLDHFVVPNTFCYAQMRNISDEEYIQKALNIEKKNIKFEPADSPQNYYQNHPGCCHVDNRSKGITINLFPKKRVSVILLYEIKNPSNSREKYFTGVIEFNPCGHLIWRTGVAEVMTGIAFKEVLQRTNTDTK